MSWFRRKLDGPEFWHQAPLIGDPETVYHRGIMAVSQGDGPMMMRVGWALWHSNGMGQHQAYDFLTDGFGAWSAQPDASYERVRQFLREMFDTLDRDAPAPYSPEYGARAWSGTELYVRAQEKGDAGTLEAYRLRLFEALVAGPPECVPVRSINLVPHLAQSLGVVNPFA